MDEYKTIKQLARELRKNQTEAEEMLWQKLRNRKLDGYKFLRQHPIIHSGFNNKLYFFIADFYCAEKELVIELDGKIHENQKEYDNNRDQILKETNLTILRFKNEELESMETVLLKIKTQLKSLSSNAPLSMSREGLGVSSNKILSILFLGLILISCSKEISYKTLNFFFDGVPDTSALPIKNDTILKANNTKKTDNLVLTAPETNRTIHPPYKNRKCKICHTDGGFTMPQPQLCYQCHEDFSSKFNFIHGPVAGGYCTACHHPHMGEKKLLLRKGQALCFYCHEKEAVFKNENHSDINETNCTECHNPHGGQEKYFFN